MERRIVVGVDGSARSRAAADWAAHEALRRALPLRVVHVTALSGQDLAELWPYFPEVAPARLVSELAARYRELTVEGVRIDGDPAAVLLAHATTADQVVLGLRGAGGCAGLPIGSVALAVAERAKRPVVLVPSGSVHEGRGIRRDKVALGIDARRPADGAVGFAFDAACRQGARLHAVHAWSMPVPQSQWLPYAVPEEDRARWEDHEVQLLADALRPWREKYPSVPVLEDVLLFSADAALVRTSDRAELLVVGRRGTKLGPAVRALLGCARCPVAVVCA